MSLARDCGCGCRWCCSGTPISTDIKDFTAQFYFLGVPWFWEKAYIDYFVRTPPSPPLSLLHALRLTFTVITLLLHQCDACMQLQFAPFAGSLITAMKRLMG